MFFFFFASAFERMCMSSGEESGIKMNENFPPFWDDFDSSGRRAKEGREGVNYLFYTTKSGKGGHHRR